jgi:hypothetical protein
MKWKGYSASSNTWESASNLTHCDAMIEDYWLSLGITVDQIPEAPPTAKHRSRKPRDGSQIPSKGKSVEPPMTVPEKTPENNRPAASTRPRLSSRRLGPDIAELHQIEAAVPSTNPKILVPRPTAVLALARATDGAVLALTETDRGPYIMTVKQIEEIDVELLFTFFEQRID